MLTKLPQVLSNFSPSSIFRRFLHKRRKYSSFYHSSNYKDSMLGNEDNTLHSRTYGETAPASQVLRCYNPVSPGTAHKIPFLVHTDFSWLYQAQSAQGGVTILSMSLFNSGCQKFLQDLSGKYGMQSRPEPALFYPGRINLNITGLGVQVMLKQFEASSAAQLFF